MAWPNRRKRDREAARTATKTGNRGLQPGPLRRAAALYEEAYKFVPDPIFLYDLGQSYRQANKPDKALTGLPFSLPCETAPEDAPKARTSRALDS